MAGCLLLVTLLVLARPTTASEATLPLTPLRFESEIVHLMVASDSLTVDGFYVLSCAPPQTGFTTLLYPYPHDPRLGGARTIKLHVRVRPDTTWQTAEFRELPHNIGAQWRLPLAPNDTLEVRTVYRQALHGPFASYIVTTMNGWEYPLRHARFEITLPVEVEPLDFSFPFQLMYRDDTRIWWYEAQNFRPEHDIEVRWRLLKNPG